MSHDVSQLQFSLKPLKHYKFCDGLIFFSQQDCEAVIFNNLCFGIMTLDEFVLDRRSSQKV